MSLDYQHHIAQQRIGVDGRSWSQKVFGSLFPRRTGATLLPVSKHQKLAGHVDNTDRIATYKSRRDADQLAKAEADLKAEAEALAASWEAADDRIVRAALESMRRAESRREAAKRKAMKRIAANRLMDRRAA